MRIQNANVNKLLDEFIKAGISPFPVLSLDGEGDFVFPDGTDMKLVQQIIDTHDPIPLPQPPTEKERIDMLENIILMMLEV